jgi:hypothetical protein
MSNQRSVVSPTRHLSPSVAAHNYDKFVQDMEVLRAHLRNHVEGVHAATPTTGSSQLTGTGNTTWNVNLSAGLITVGGVALTRNVAADYSVHSGSYYTGFANGKSAIATIIAKNVAGTVSLAVVKGAAATTGSQVAPTDAECQTAAGAGNDFVKICELTLNRTGDTTVTESQDNTKRPIPAVTRDLAFGDWSAIAPAV